MTFEPKQQYQLQRRKVHPNPMDSADVSEFTKTEILFWARKLHLTPSELFALTEEELAVGLAVAEKQMLQRRLNFERWNRLITVRKKILQQQQLQRLKDDQVSMSSCVTPMAQLPYNSARMQQCRCAKCNAKQQQRQQEQQELQQEQLELQQEQEELLQIQQELLQKQQEQQQHQRQQQQHQRQQQQQQEEQQQHQRQQEQQQHQRQQQQQQQQEQQQQNQRQQEQQQHQQQHQHEQQRQQRQKCRTTMKSRASIERNFTDYSIYVTPTGVQEQANSITLEDTGGNTGVVRAFATSTYAPLPLNRTTYRTQNWSTHFVTPMAPMLQKASTTVERTMMPPGCNAMLTPEEFDAHNFELE